jgi:hypothetical protein
MTVPLWNARGLQERSLLVEYHLVRPVQACCCALGNVPSLAACIKCCLVALPLKSEPLKVCYTCFVASAGLHRIEHLRGVCRQQEAWTEAHPPSRRIASCCKENNGTGGRAARDRVAHPVGGAAVPRQNLEAAAAARGSTDAPAGDAPGGGPGGGRPLARCAEDPRQLRARRGSYGEAAVRLLAPGRHSAARRSRHSTSRRSRHSTSRRSRHSGHGAAGTTPALAWLEERRADRIAAVQAGETLPL